MSEVVGMLEVFSFSSILPQVNTSCTAFQNWKQLNYCWGMLRASTDSTHSPKDQKAWICQFSKVKHCNSDWQVCLVKVSPSTKDVLQIFWQQNCSLSAKSAVFYFFFSPLKNKFLTYYWQQVSRQHLNIFIVLI